MPPEPVSAPRAATKWTEIPALGVRVECEGKATMVGSQALVTCGSTVLSVSVDEGATSIDQALAAHQVEERAYLQSTAKNVTRSPHRYRKAYENQGGQGTNYWVDVMIELGGRVLTCQTGSIGTADTSSRIAAAAGDLCETIQPLR
jgi:hypothetical protein